MTSEVLGVTRGAARGSDSLRLGEGALRAGRKSAGARKGCSGRWQHPDCVAQSAAFGGRVVPRRFRGCRVRFEMGGDPVPDVDLVRAISLSPGDGYLASQVCAPGANGAYSLRTLDASTFLLEVWSGSWEGGALYGSLEMDSSSVATVGGGRLGVPIVGQDTFFLTSYDSHELGALLLPVATSKGRSRVPIGAPPRSSLVGTQGGHGSERVWEMH